MSVWVDLVHCFTRCPPRLTVKIKTLHKNTVIAETSDPYITFSIETQLNAFANVQPATHKGMVAFGIKATKLTQMN